MKKRAFLFAMHPSLESTVNCTVQIGEPRASNLSSFVTFRRKVQVKLTLKIMPKSTTKLVRSIMRYIYGGDQEVTRR